MFKCQLFCNHISDRCTPLHKIIVNDEIWQTFVFPKYNYKFWGNQHVIYKIEYTHLSKPYRINIVAQIVGVLKRIQKGAMHVSCLAFFMDSNLHSWCLFYKMTCQRKRFQDLKYKKTITMSLDIQPLREIGNNYFLYFFLNQKKFMKNSEEFFF